MKFVLLLSILFCSVNLYAQEDALALKSVRVEIETYNAKGKCIRKTNGCLISEKGEVISNLSVTSGAGFMKVKTAENETFKVEGIIGESREQGIIKITLNAERKNFPAVRLAEKEGNAGEKVRIIYNEEIVEGEIAEIKKVRGKRLLKISAPRTFKIKGNPVFNIRGEIVGIILFSSEKESSVYALSVSEKTPFKNYPLMSISDWSEKRRSDWLESPGGLRYTALYLMGLGKYEKAVEYFHKLTKKIPDDAEGCSKMGYCYVKLGKYKEAKEVYQTVTELTPDDPLAHYNLGLAYLSLKDYEEANEEYEILKKMRPGLADKLYSHIQEKTIIKKSNLINNDNEE